MDKTLEKWMKCKEKVAILEKRMEKYKTEVEQEMRRQNISEIRTRDFKVVRRSNTRKQLSKSNVPPNIWEQYATRSHYNSYYLSRQ